HGEFATAAGGAGEKKIGDVGASDQKHETNGADEHENGGTNVASELVTKWNSKGTVPSVGVGMFGFELLGYDGEIGICSGQRDAEFEASDDLEIVAVVLGEFLLGEMCGCPDLSLAIGKLETARHHADDSAFFVVQKNVSAYDAGVATE